MATAATCPYCKAALEKPPARKKACPSCGQFIFVRRGMLVTEEEAQIQDWTVRLEGIGITRSMFDRERQSLTQRFNRAASATDAIWGLLNQRVLQVKSFHERKIIYLEMANVLRQEGKSFNHILTEAAKQDLLNAQQLGIKRVEILTANDGNVCAGCRAHAGRVLTIKDALATTPIPNDCASPNGCRCMYLSVLD